MNQKAIAGLILIGIIVALISIFTFGGYDKPEIKRTEEEIKSGIIKKQFSGWDGSHIKLTNHIKQIMNDPNSYEHIETRYWEYYDFIVVETKFRGANAFGAKVINTIQAKISLRDEILEVADNVHASVKSAEQERLEREIFRGIEEETKEISNDKQSNPLSGEYWVLVDRYYGSDKEKYILNPNGSAVWEYISKAVSQKKYGTWKSKSNGKQIVISIKGNSGQIEEIYDLKNGKFRSGDRYLKRYKLF